MELYELITFTLRVRTSAQALPRLQQALEEAPEG